MRLKCCDRQRIVPPAFRAANQRQIFKYIHLAQGKGCCMSLETTGELALSLPSIGRFSRICRFGRNCGGSHDDRSKRQVMDRSAGAATEDQSPVVSQPFDRNAEGVHRPALLKKCAATKHLRHDRQAFTAQRRSRTSKGPSSPRFLIHRESHRNTTELREPDPATRFRRAVPYRQTHRTIREA